MRISRHLGLRLPDSSDRYDIADANYNTETIDTAIADLSARLGVTIVRCTQAEYDALTPDPDTVYYAVDDGGKVKQYLGDAELTSGQGTVAGIAAVYAQGSVSDIAGKAEIITEEDQ